MSEKRIKKLRREKRTRARVKSAGSRSRLSVFRSLNHIYAQIIDDGNGKTLISASDKDIKPNRKAKEKAEQKEKMAGKVAVAYEVGKEIAIKATAKKIETVVFDRGGYKYHGRVKALADGARDGGLKF